MTEVVAGAGFERTLSSLLGRGGKIGWPVDVRLSPGDNCGMMVGPTLHLRKAAESPLGPAVYCFPPASPAIASEAGKQKTTPKDRSDSLICLKKIGAGEGIRTLDPDLGNSLTSSGDISLEATVLRQPPRLHDC